MVIKLKEVSPLPTFTFNPPSPTDPAATSTSEVSAAPTNPTEFILAKDQTLFGAHPLQTERGKGLLKCVKCGKVVTEAVASEHKRTSHNPDKWTRVLTDGNRDLCACIGGDTT